MVSPASCQSRAGQISLSKMAAESLHVFILPRLINTCTVRMLRDSDTVEDIIRKVKVEKNISERIEMDLGFLRAGDDATVRFETFSRQASIGVSLEKMAEVSPYSGGTYVYCAHSQ